MSEWLTERPTGVRIAVLINPKSSRDRSVGTHDGRLKIQLTAAAVDGEANAALVRFLARQLGLRKADVTIVSGATGRRKKVDLACSTGEVEARLAKGLPR